MPSRHASASGETRESGRAATVPAGSCETRDKFGLPSFPENVDVTRTIVAANWSNGRRTLFIEQEGRIRSADLGILRADVSVFLTADRQNERNRMRAALFCPRTFEWKEVTSYGSASMRFFADMNARMAKDPAGVLSEIHATDVDITEGFKELAGVTEYSDALFKSVLFAWVHQKLHLAIQDGRMEDIARGEFDAGWTGLAKLFA
jgi:hypothetical protein